MANRENFTTESIVCRGGLNSNQNWLQLSSETPGMATQLVNFEPSLTGGYRRISGFAYLEDTDTGEVDSAGAEGKILGLAIFDGDILAMRKQQAGATYEFYAWVASSNWSKYTTGLTRSSTNVNKIRHHGYNYDGTEKMLFVDGVNKAAYTDKTNWYEIDPAASGANDANAGGAQALSAPKYVHVWKRTSWMADDYIIAYSAPASDYDWTSANGAGQINPGFKIKQIYPFRDQLFVFGENNIGYIYVDGTDFAFQDVTSDIGLVGSDTVLEVGGDLVFLSQDGFRPVSATDRIGDFEIANISKSIQQDLRSLIANYSNVEIHACTVRSKSQIRCFFSDSTVDIANCPGIIGAQKEYQGSLFWEYGRLLGFKVTVAESGYIDNTEYVLHGDFDGKVFRQEQGNSFNSASIKAIYTTPYLDFGTPSLRKTPYKVALFCKPEGDLDLDVYIKYDWEDTEVINPAVYDASSTGGASAYGTALYGAGTYGGTSEPRILTNVQGSGNSMQITTVTDNTNSSYTIHGLVFDFKVHGYK